MSVKFSLSRFRAYSRFLDIPVHRKLILVYLLGIFLPLFLTNIYFSGNLLVSARKQEDAHLQNTFESLVYALEGFLEPINLVSHAIVADAAIYRFLLNRYEPGDYFPVHFDYLRPALYKYTSGFRALEKILIYTANPTIGVSAGYVSLSDQNRESIWYRELVERGRKELVLYYLETDRRTSVQVEERFLSLFRVMAYPSLSTNQEMILRMDIQRNEFISIFENSALKGNLAIRDSLGNIVVSWSSDPAETNRGPSIAVDQVLRFADRLRLTGTVWSEGQALSEDIQLPGFVLVTLLSFGLSLLFIVLLSVSVTSRIQLLSTHLKKVELQDFRPITMKNPGRDEIGALLRDFNIMAERIDFLINQVYRSDLKQKELMIAQKQAELNALQSQINPHFMNNVFESIRMRSVLKDEKETAAVMLKLSRLFRRMLNWESDLIPLGDELQFTREYLEIQQYRFNQQLSFDIRVPPGCGDRLVPKMTIQGFVENACIHGIEKKVGKGRVEVEIRDRQGSLEIRIEDDGVGFTPGTQEHGIGITNIIERLRLHYRDAGSVTLESEPGRGTSVHIVLPPQEDGVHVHPGIR